MSRKDAVKALAEACGSATAEALSRVRDAREERRENFAAAFAATRKDVAWRLSRNARRVAAKVPVSPLVMIDAGLRAEVEAKGKEAKLDIWAADAKKILLSAIRSRQLSPDPLVHEMMILAKGGDVQPGPSQIAAERGFSF